MSATDVFNFLTTMFAVLGFLGFLMCAGVFALLSWSERHPQTPCDAKESDHG